MYQSISRTVYTAPLIPSFVQRRYSSSSSSSKRGQARCLTQQQSRRSTAAAAVVSKKTAVVRACLCAPSISLLYSVTRPQTRQQTRPIHMQTKHLNDTAATPRISLYNYVRKYIYIQSSIPTTTTPTAAYIHVVLLYSCSWYIPHVCCYSSRLDLSEIYAHTRRISSSQWAMIM